MSYDARKNCLGCAWRENCKKRFTAGDDAGLHCADFSEDLRLKKERPPSEEGSANSKKCE